MMQNHNQLEWVQLADQCERYMQKQGNKDTKLIRIQYKEQMCIVKKGKYNTIIPQQFNICQRLQQQPKQYLVPILQTHKSRTHYYILMPVYTWNLDEYLQENESKLRENPTVGLDIFLQICYGLANLNRMHRDVKPTNVLVKGQITQLEVVLADFNQANNGEIFDSACLGTQFYMAPEIKYGKGRAVYTSKVDVWSLVIVLFEIMGVFNERTQKNHPRLRQFPAQIENILNFESNNQKEMKKFLEDNRPIIAQKIPKFLKHLMRVSLETSPEKRPTLSTILIYLQYCSKGDEQIQNISYFKTPTYKKISHYRQILQNKQIKTGHHSQNLIILKELYQKWYLPLRGFVENCQSESMATFLYCGILNIINIYKQLKDSKAIKESVLISIITDDQKGLFSMLNIQANFIILKAKMDRMDKHQSRILDEAKQQKNWQKIQNKVLRNKFNKDQIQQIIGAYRQIFQPNLSLIE